MDRVTPDDPLANSNVKHALALLVSAAHVKPAAAVSGGDATEGSINPGLDIRLGNAKTKVFLLGCTLSDYPYSYTRGVNQA